MSTALQKLFLIYLAPRLNFRFAFILPEPGPLESAKSYREKKAKPLLAQIVKVLRSVYRAYLDLKSDLAHLQGQYNRAVNRCNSFSADRLQLGNLFRPLLLFEVQHRQVLVMGALVLPLYPVALHHSGKLFLFRAYPLALSGSSGLSARKKWNGSWRTQSAGRRKNGSRRKQSGGLDGGRGNGHQEGTPRCTLLIYTCQQGILLL